MNCDIIVVGASAGGVDAVSRVLQGLPKDLSAAVFVVLHFPATSRSMLPDILRRVTRLTVKTAVNGDLIEAGCVYVAIPDHHLLLDKDSVMLTRGPKENRARPAIDPLFRSAAEAFGSRVIGVILSGALDDGTAGLQFVKKHGGIAVVQDPDDALHPGMPRSAIDNVKVDHILKLSEIPGLLQELVGNGAVGNERSSEMPPSRPEEVIKDPNLKSRYPDDGPGTPTVYTCPDCHGTLWELKHGNWVQFLCRTGHLFSPENLLAGQDDNVEEALWAAVRALEENAAFAARMAEQARARGHHTSANQFHAHSETAEELAATIRNLLISKTPGEPAPS